MPQALALNSGNNEARAVKLQHQPGPRAQSRRQMLLNGYGKLKVGAVI
jgi:hypothetical protein